MNLGEEIFAFVDTIDEAVILSHVLPEGEERTCYINSSIEEFIGKKLTKEQVQEFNLLNIVHPEDHRKYENYLRNLIQNSVHQVIQIRILHPQEEGFIWVELQGRVQEKKDQKKLLFHMLRNVDLQVQAETFLRQSEQKHRLLFTRANDAIFIIKNMEIIDCNEKTLTMFESPGYSGISRKELYHFMPEIQKGGEDSVLNFHYLVQRALNGEPQFFYWIFSRFGGTQFESEVSLSGFEIGEDKLVQVIVRDISLRKKAEEEQLRAQVAEKTNKALKKEIEQRKKVQEALTAARQYSESIINSSLDIIVACDKQGLITEFNEAGFKIFGYGKEAIGKQVRMLFNDDEQANQLIKSVVQEGSFLGEITAKRSSGKPFSSYVSASKLLNNKGETIGTVGVIKDASELKKSERKLRAIVKQKEVLLREVHHRVKNNLQVITSILKLQSTQIKDEKALLAINDCQDRIKSIAFIHESLYQSNDLAKVNFAEYLRILCNNLLFSYQVDGEKVKLNIQIEQVSLSLDTGISCGLIVNELISNSFKHAFVAQDQGVITVTLVKTETGHRLTVKDNGKGFPEGLDYKKVNSLGLQLVVGLVDQIDGKIEYEKVAGTHFNINFSRS